MADPDSRISFPSGPILPDYSYHLNDGTLRQWALVVQFGGLSLENSADSLVPLSNSDLLKGIEETKLRIAEHWAEVHKLGYTIVKYQYLLSPIRRLSDDLLARIFDHLDFPVLPCGYSERAKFMGVCKRWHDVIKSFGRFWNCWVVDETCYRHRMWLREIKHVNGPATLDVILQADGLLSVTVANAMEIAARLRRLTVQTGHWSEALHRGLDAAKNLVYLEIHWTSVRPTRDDDLLQAVTMENLRSLKSIEGLPTFPLITPNLKKLELRNVLSESGVVTVLRPLCKSISHLTLLGCTISWEGAQPLELANLVCLEVDDTLSLPFFRKSITSLKILRVLGDYQKNFKLATYLTLGNLPSWPGYEEMLPPPNMKLDFVQQLELPHGAFSLFPSYYNLAFNVTVCTITVWDIGESVPGFRTFWPFYQTLSETPVMPNLRHLNIIYKLTVFYRSVLRELFEVAYHRYLMSLKNVNSPNVSMEPCKFTICWEGGTQFTVDPWDVNQDWYERAMSHYAGLDDTADDWGNRPVIQEATWEELYDHYCSVQRPVDEDEMSTECTSDGDGSSEDDNEEGDSDDDKEEKKDVGMLSDWDSDQSVHSDDDAMLTDG